MRVAFCFKKKQLNKKQFGIYDKLASKLYGNKKNVTNNLKLLIFIN